MLTPPGRPQRRWIGQIAALALGVGVILGLRLVWINLLVDHIVVRNFGVVEPGKVYRTRRLTEQTPARVTRDNGIKTIVDFGAYSPDSPQEETEAAFAGHNGINRVVLRLYGDGTGNPNAYVQALKIMNDPANQPVLVHCSAGSERTGIAVMLYRNIFQGVPLEEAEAIEFKHSADRSSPFMPFVHRWRDPIAAALKSGSLIPDIAPADALTAATAPQVAEVAPKK
ncbi:MAG: tyrosine-protein phosphatase [Phycisphaerales bacterium]|nr:tyrosine-protein phosphatase [Phycisphaerales bacterium]